ncbi:MAG: YfhO family protein, partial [Candidatus Bathyarchaeia archaeon]
FGRSITAFGAMLYGLFPYHIVDAHYRMAFPEFYAFVAIPPLIKGATEQLNIPNKRASIIIAASTAFLVLAHNVSAFYIMLLCALWVAFVLMGRVFKTSFSAWVKNCLKIFIPFALGLGLSAFYWMPAFFEFKYINPNVLKEPISRSFLSLKELFYIGIPLTFDEAKIMYCKNVHDQPLLIGAPYIAALAILLVGIFNKRFRNLSIFLTFSSLALIFLMLHLSNPLWTALRPLRVVQFAWRFLQWIGFATSMGFCIGLASLSNKFKFKRSAQLFISVLFFTLASMYATSIYVFGIGWLQSHSQKITRLNKSHLLDPMEEYEMDYIVRWLDLLRYKPKPDAIVLNENVEASVIKHNPHSLTMNIDSYASADIVLNIVYFPGWRLTIDGKKKELKISERGFLQFVIPQGKHRVELRFLPTPTRAVAVFISLISLAIFLWLVFGKVAGVLGISLAILLSLVNVRGGIAALSEFPPMPSGKNSYRWGCEIKEDERFLVRQVPDNIVQAQTNFDNKIEFIGYRYSVKRGKVNGFLEIEFYWRALSKMDEDYMLFIFFEPKISSGESFGLSHQGVCWTYETSRWKEGEIIREFYELALDEKLLGKSYKMRVGVLDENKMEFLPIAGQQKEFVESDFSLGQWRHDGSN